MDELDLIRRILADDESAKTRLYHEYRKRLVPVTIYFLGPHDPESEDIVQETFRIALEKLKDFEPRCSLYTWLAHITANLCYARLRKRKRMLATLGEDLERIAHASQDRDREEKDQEEKIREERRRGLAEKIRGLLGDLAAPCRKIIELRDLKGTSYAGVSRILRIPLGTVMSRLYRCRQALKRLLEDAARSKGST